MKKGFTLIELLAVIVILAIISLIAVPIVINIINDSKEESQKRSIDMYGKAIENAIAKNQILNRNNKLTGIYNTKDNNIVKNNNVNEVLKIEYNGSSVKCDLIKIYDDGKIYLKKCSVNGEKTEYEYGMKRVCQEYIDDSGYRMANCGNEKFYILNDYLELESDNKIIMLASKNLKLVDGYYMQSDSYPTIKFSSQNYWVDDVCPYANDVSNRWRCIYKQKYIDSNHFVYDENADIYKYINGYQMYLSNILNVKSAKTTIPSEELLNKLGCSSNSCLNAPEWVYSTSYWIGTACNVTGTMLRLKNDGSYECGWYHETWGWGARPVVTISFDDLS